MKQRIFHSAWFAAAITIIAVAASCRQQADVVKTPAAAADLGPEESFTFIVETFRRNVEDIPIGFVVRDAGGHSMMTGKNEVRHELKRPEKEGDPYRAIITVESEWRYSMQRTNEVGETDGEDTAKDGSGNVTQSQDGTGAEILDPSLVGTAGGEPEVARPSAENSDKSDVTVTRRADKKDSKYDLVYENGRWVLTTKLDPNTEKSIQFAFDRALDTQN
jgi:hypothetical protein